MNAILETPTKKTKFISYDIYDEIKLSEKEIEEGEVKDAKEALKNLREKYGI